MVEQHVPRLMRNWWWPVALIMALPGGKAAVSAQVQSSLKVAVSARAIQPGEVVWMEVTCPDVLERVDATVFGRTVTLDAAPDRRTWVALIGIDLGTAPGEQVVRIEAVKSGASRLSTTYTLPVSPKRFETRRLEVAARYVNPPQTAMARIQREAKRTQAIFDAVTPRRWQGRFLLPVSDQPTSNFGSRSVYNGQPRSPHTGIDFPSAPGTAVHASNSGRIVLADNLYFTGNTVIVDYGSGVYSLFAHLSKVAVTEGESVGPETVVGLVGATGRVTGPHLHWAVRIRGTRVDPLSLVAASRP
jgi:murein DD-endopeptidase MepM/ murein hydrolase activator NlpD